VNDFLRFEQDRAVVAGLVSPATNNIPFIVGEKHGEVGAGTTTAMNIRAARKEAISEDRQKEINLRRMTQGRHEGGGGKTEREIEPVRVQPSNRMSRTRPDFVKEDSLLRGGSPLVARSRDPWVTCNWHVRQGEL
jgi:hypothetical protein